MLRSMTGFGRGTGRAGATEAVVEVRAVNGRFAEVGVRSPRVLNAFDPAVQALCKEELERGSVTVSITLQRQGAEAALAVDRAAARAYGRLLLELQAAAGLDPQQAPVTLDHLLRYDVLSSAEADVEAEQAEAWAAVEPALQEALARVDAMRLQEGRALREDLTARLDALEAHLAAVAERAPARVREAQVRLRERLAELLADSPPRPGGERLNPERLETEIALLADRLDVNEEVVRLRSHLGQFREALDAEEAVGRRLNFLAQELNREVNTIASKANDAELAQRAVRMKEELEKVREQVQNVV